MAFCCCCIPLRLGVFFIALIAVLVNGVALYASIVTFEAPGLSKMIKYLSLGLSGLSLLCALSGFMSVFKRSPSLARIFSTFLWSELILMVVSLTWRLIEVAVNRQVAIDSCLSEIQTRDPTLSDPQGHCSTMFLASIAFLASSLIFFIVFFSYFANAVSRYGRELTTKSETRSAKFSYITPRQPAMAHQSSA